MPRAKITVVARVANHDVIAAHMGEEHRKRDIFPCQNFYDGQEFIIESWGTPPAGFCNWAWADIHKYILLVMGGGSFGTWVEPEGAAIACCTDGYRPVVFKIERIKDG